MTSKTLPDFVVPGAVDYKDRVSGFFGNEAKYDDMITSVEGIYNDVVQRHEDIKEIQIDVKLSANESKEWALKSKASAGESAESAITALKYKDETFAIKDFAAGSALEAKDFRDQTQGIYNNALTLDATYKDYVVQAAAEVEKAKVQVTLASDEVGKAKAEVVNAQAEVGKAAGQVALAKNEVVNASKEVDKAKLEVQNAKKEVVNASLEVDKAAAEVQKAVHEVLNAKQYATESRGAANDAVISENESLRYLNLSVAMYEDLRKGQVYRGTWNPHTNAYPSAEGTNSVWDVILNENETEYEWNGIRWWWGDRLVYIKDTNKYQQVESGHGGSVVSVNGKIGAVVLNANDVKALPNTGGRVTGLVNADQVSVEGDVAIQFRNKPGTADVTWSMGNDPTYGSFAMNRYVDGVWKDAPFQMDGRTGEFHNWTTIRIKGQEIYHPGNLPSSKDMTATDNRTVKPSDVAGRAIAGYFTETAALLPGTPGYCDLIATNSYGDASGGWMNGIGFAKDNSGKVYHVNGQFGANSWDSASEFYTSKNLPNKLIASPVVEAGQKPLLWLNDNGTVGGDSSITLYNPTTGDIRATKGYVYAKAGFYDDGHTVYSGKNKPTAADVGALSIKGGKVDGIVEADAFHVYGNSALNFNGDSAYTWRMGSEPSNGTFIINRYKDYYWQDTPFAIGGWDGAVSIGTSLNIQGNKVYHANDKPTAVEIGALPLTGGDVDGGVAVKRGFHVGNVTSGASVDSGDIWQMWSGGNPRLLCGSGSGAGDYGGYQWLAGDKTFHMTHSGYAANSVMWYGNDGKVNVREDPVEPTGIANKRYVDQAIAAGGGGGGGAVGPNLHLDGKLTFRNDNHSISSKASNSMNWESGQFSFITAGKGTPNSAVYIGSNAQWNGSWSKFDNNVQSCVLELNGSQDLIYYHSEAGQTSPVANRHSIFTSLRPPSAAQTGALPIDTPITGVKSVTVAKGEGVIYRDDGTGMLWKTFQPTNNDNIEFARSNNGGQSWVTMMKVDVNGSIYSGNNRVYTTGYKPTPTDLGAASTDELAQVNGELSSKVTSLTARVVDLEVNLNPHVPDIGNVGSYGFMNPNSPAMKPGDVIVGSRLRWANAAAGYEGDWGGTTEAPITGTWRCMGYVDDASFGARASLFIRIA